jgi:hypothetical protein
MFLLAAMMLAAMPFSAFADNVVNDVTVGGNDTFTAPGSTTINYKVNANGGDGQSGCNASDGSPATVTLSVPANVTASTTSLTFSACNVFQNVTFSSSTPGTYAINVIKIADSGTGSYNDQADFTLHVNAPPPPPNTAPSVSVTEVTNDAAYEFGSVPVAGCSVTDAEDGPSSPEATLSEIFGPLASYGLGSQTASCAYTDAGGLKASASATYSIVDTGNPTITDLGPTTGPDGANGWYVSAVTNEFRASDSGAGFAGESNPYTFTKSSGATEGSAVTIASGPVSDVAGNTNPGINSAAFKIDLSDPTNVAFVGGPSAGGSYYFNSVPAAPTCTADDAVSGLASCVVTGYSNAVGSHTMTATATDNAGRKATAELSYEVKKWTLNGFYQPVDMGGVFNTVKGGSTVPLKFEVFAGATELTATSVVKSFVQTKIACETAATIDEIEVTTTGGTSLRYDATAGQFIQNWQTPKAAGSCYRVTMATQDGSSLVAFFKLK